MASKQEMENPKKDVESGKPGRISWFKMVLDQQVVTDEVVNWHYDGAGTEEDPYVVTWIDDDPRNPMLFATWQKWCLTQLVAMATLAVAFVSSAYSGGVTQIIEEFHTSPEVVTLGISVFVLGFAIGPLMWAPLSELFGRQYLYIGTYAMLTFFNAGAAASQNIWTLIILRFFAGAFGSSPLTNAGGVIADIFPASSRGLAMSLFAASPFLGPVIGPIVGGFAGESIGWRWVEGIMAIFTGVLWIIGTALIPETYPPVLLRQRAKKLSKLSGKVYMSQGDIEQGKTTIGQAFKTSLSRPWILLFREPIVLLLSIYMAIIYGTLYMLFAAFPIVYQEYRGWSEGIGGLAFLGVAVGMIFAVAYSIWDNKRYNKTANNDPSGFAPPEARLPPAMIGGIAIPVGLIIFAWTNYPDLPWIASIIAGVPFGFGMVLVFLAIMNYLIDAYVIFAASVLAANAVLRSVFGAVFPLFTSYMYDSLGIHWATMIPALLALACTPFPFLFYKYGAAVRKRCKFAAQAAQFMDRMRGQQQAEKADDTETGDNSSHMSSKADEETKSDEKEHEKEREEVAEQEAFDYSYEDEVESRKANSRFRSIQPGGMKRTITNTSHSETQSRDYDASPYDIDRVNTNDFFGIHKTTSRTPASRPASIRSGRSAMMF